MSDNIQEIILQVPINFEIPNIFNSLPPDEVGRILKLGAISYEIIQQEGNKSDHDVLYSSLKKEASKQYQPIIDTLQKQYTASSELAVNLKQRLQNEEASRLDLERRIRDEERRNREDLLKEKDTRITSLEQQMRMTLSNVEQGMKDSSRSLTEGFHAFKEHLLKNTGSQKKGVQGEGVFMNYVQRVFGSGGIKEEFTLEDVGKEGHQGDLRMRWKGHKVLWEVKNYGRNVDQKEVTKFLRDMEENKDISVGIMVSLTSGITGHQKTGNIDLQELPDGRMCIFINYFLKNEDPTCLLQSLMPFIETFLNIKKIEDNNQEPEIKLQIERFEYQRSVLIRLLKNHEESTRKFKNVMMNAKKKNDQIWIELTTEMRESEYQVKLLIETLLDKGSDDNDDIQEIRLPEYIFRNTDIKMYNEKERVFITDTLKSFTFSEDYSMSTKHIKEIYKTLGYSEDAVNKMRQRIFNDSAWEKGKTVVIGIKPLAT
jgi:hypothetical protein